MANLRQLRKHVEYVCGDLAAECMVASGLDGQISPDELKQIITKIAVLQAQTEARINVKFDKTEREFPSAKAFRAARTAYFRQAYKALLADFAKGVQAIVDEINALLKKA